MILIIKQLCLLLLCLCPKPVKDQMTTLCLHILWLHHCIALCLLIIFEQMSQDTYIVSYGNFIPERVVMQRWLCFLYCIMIHTLSLDAIFIFQCRCCKPSVSISDFIWYLEDTPCIIRVFRSSYQSQYGAFSHFVKCLICFSSWNTWEESWASMHAQL